MAGTPGTFRFPEVNAKPSAPPAGYALLYIKTDNVLYLQDSSATEIALGSASSITQLVGEATAVGPGIATITLNNSAVIGKVLTGFTPGPNSTILATDTILQAFQKIQAQVTATVGAAVTSLIGDVTGTGPGATSTTVVSVGGSTAANIHSAELAANAATASNTASTIVKRDASGNFIANQITASTFVGNLTGNVTGNVSGSSSSFTGSLLGDVTGIQSATVVSFVGGSTAANIHSAEVAANAATSTNTASTIVERDASGNFSAAIITAALIGNVTGNVSGTALNVTGIVSIANGGTNSATALSNNRIMTSQGGAIVENSAITAHRAIVSNSNGLPIASVTSDTEIGYVSGVTSSIQSQLNAITSTYITSLTGDGTATGPGASVFTLTNSSVTGQVLTGYVTGPNTSVLATDSILQAIEKLQGQASATSSSAITALTGDVTATGPGSVSATVNTVGGSSASNIHSAELAANAATSANTASTIVKRDSSGNFSAGIISAALNGNASTATTSISFSGSLLGDVTGIQGATVVSKIQGTSITGTTGTGNVVLSASPTLTGTLNAAAAIFSGSISASNFSGASSGTNTGDVSLTNTNSINLSFSSGQTGLSATLNLSAAIADANNLKATYSIKTDGLFIEYPFGIAVNIGTTNSAGSSSSFSLSDHVHAISSTVVLGLALTGYVTGSNTPITSANTLLVAFENLQAQISATVGAAITALTGDVTATGPGSATATVNSVGGSLASNIHSAELAANAATAVDTVSTIVKRDGSGNFAAGVITASLTGNVTGNVSGSAASFTGTLSGDVTGTQSTTAISSTTVTGKLLTGFTVGSNTAIIATDSILIAFEKTQAQINATVGAAITSLTGDVTATGPGASAATIAVGAVTDTKASLAVKPAVTVVATTNQTLSGAPTIDGQATTAGTSIALLTAQTTTSDNGPWIVQSGAWTRPTWYPNAGITQAFQFITTFVRLGTVYGGSVWRQTAAAPITIGTTATTWAVTPTKGNFSSSYTTGPQTGSAEVDVVFSNANQGTLGWNPTSSFKLLLPPTQGAAGTLLSNDGSGVLSWVNTTLNIDGGAANSVYTAGQSLNGGTA